jgi:hypothetical protein
MNTKGIAPVIIIIAVAVLIGIGFIAGQILKVNNSVSIPTTTILTTTTQEPTTTSTKSINTTSTKPKNTTITLPKNLKTYIDKEYGFEFQYNENPDFSFRVIPINQNCGDISQNCPKFSDLSSYPVDFQYFGNDCNRANNCDNHLLKEVFNSIPFCVVGYMENAAGSFTGTNYYITKHNNKCFALSLSSTGSYCDAYDPGSIEQKKCEEENKETEKETNPDNIMSTFKFID